MRKKNLKFVTIIMLIMIVFGLLPAKASAGLSTGRLDGTSGYITYSFSVNKSMRAYTWAIMFENRTSNYVDTLKIEDMMCEYADNSEVEFNNITQSNTKLITKVGDYNSKEIANAVARFTIISSFCGSVSEIVFYD